MGLNSGAEHIHLCVEVQFMFSYHLVCLFAGRCILGDVIWAAYWCSTKTHSFDAVSTQHFSATVDTVNRNLMSSTAAYGGLNVTT